MEFRLTSESMELLIESIVDAVESTDDRDMQFELVLSARTKSVPLPMRRLWNIRTNWQNWKIRLR